MVTRHGGLTALGRMAAAVRRSLQQRGEVSRMIRVSRRAVERIGRSTDSVAVSSTQPL